MSVCLKKNRVIFLVAVTAAVCFLLFGMSPQTMLSETILKHYNGETIPKREYQLKWTRNCTGPLLYNKIYLQGNLINLEVDLQNNIRHYCGAKGNIYSILGMKPIKFDTDFRNPCWIDGTGPIADDEIHCLPYVYILGMKKSGTTDIFARLDRHPLFQSAGYKELQWFPRLRFGRAVGSPLNKKYIKDLVRKGPDVQSINFYIAMFDPVAQHIRSFPTKVQGNRTIYKLITGDATTNTLLENPRWHLWPGNEGLIEPRYTNLHYIKHLTPDAKIIILFRDPVERLYSDFLYTMRGKYEQLISPELFHSHVLSAISLYRDCMRDHSLRQCFYNETVKEILKQEGVQFAESFHGGFYAFIISEIYSVFDKRNVMAQVMFDKPFSLESTMKRIFKFLNIGIPSKEIMTKILGQYTSNTSTKKRRMYGSILNKTIRVLREFYRPYNREMAELMNNDRYLFRSLGFI